VADSTQNNTMTKINLMYKEIEIFTSVTPGICQLLNSCWHFRET